jgi:hypothetical protein
MLGETMLEGTMRPACLPSGTFGESRDDGADEDQEHYRNCRLILMTVNPGLTVHRRVG